MSKWDGLMLTQISRLLQWYYCHLRRRSSVPQNRRRCCFSLVPESLPASKKQSQTQRSFPQVREKGRLARQVLAPYSCRGSDCSGFCSQCLYPLRECFAEEEGNRMKRSWCEQNFSPFCHHHNQPCKNKGAAEMVQHEVLVMWLPTGFAGEAMGKPFS